MSVFKENDIRGLYPDEWNSSTVLHIAGALPEIIKGGRIVLGRDGRDSSLEIRELLIKGLLEKGIEVADIGIVDTPAIYFAVGYYGFDGGIMITASHNPPGYNGLKLTGKNAVPIEYTSGIQQLEALVCSRDKEALTSGDSALLSGKLSEIDITGDYINYLTKFRMNMNELRIIFDCSSGSSGRFIGQILDGFPGELKVLNSEIDGTFPNHGPNPTLPENLQQLKGEVLKSGADIGFCFDGDGDRVVVIDEFGDTVSPDLITALLGIYYFKYGDNKGQKVLVDLRSSRSITDVLKTLGADVKVCPVGHAKIKKQMREEDALFAGELTGHYYFRENYFSDSAWLTVFRILEVLSLEKKTITRLRHEILKYEFSGEVNFRLENDPEAMIQILLKKFSDAEITLLDGYKFDYPDWWFMFRKSGTEPMLRLVAEAETKELLDRKLKEIIPVIEESLQGARG